MVLGILSIFVWPIYYVGFLVSAAGLALGASVLRHHRSRVAVLGLSLAGIGLVLTVVDLKFGLLDIILKTYFQY